ncbi:hypothetical protein KDA_61450 [Dictyobacter alpinus]|uniref:Cell envelope-related transcriptional attenuator domain-containing protein n=1 Tax=Dictyobacter alpinus TaxID=2014873 RepID=A0A402BGX3_9CHLR|nr:LCP family protein [Dictyobacter alpinus]GCE30661.1 hypothetical protein KDA_61450 [Dictyobacter alpinus]
MNKFSFDDEKTQRIPPSSQGAGPGQQGKLVLGNNSVQPDYRQHQPYAAYPQVQHAPVASQVDQLAPTMYVQPPMSVPPQSAPVYPQIAQPGQPGNNKKMQAKRPRRMGCLVGLGILLVVCILSAIVSQRVLAFGSAISPQSPLSTQTNYMGTSDRVNMLVMGYGGGNHDGANLIDSMVVVSTLPQNHHTSLISIPRDLYVQYPPNSGKYVKMNEIYEDASQNGAQRIAGSDATVAKVKLVTGLDVKYWLMIDFNGFRELIDSIGGVDVYVPDAFTAKYPKNDDAKQDASWIYPHFSKGNQHMDGETAIRYARARYATDNLAEGSDFARSARQQIIIKAVLAKVKQVSTWPSMFNALDALQKTIYTNLSMADLMQLALKVDLNDVKTAHIGLSNQNVLEDAYIPFYVARPKNGDWSLISRYVQAHLYN